MENKSGSGTTTPFGNENGNIASAGASSGTDFTKNPAGQSPKGGGRDFTKENRTQQSGPPGYNPASVPAGGPILKADPGPVSRNVAGTAVPNPGPKSFRLKGG